MISKILQIRGWRPRICKSFSRSLEQFFLTVGQNNFGNKIPFLSIFSQTNKKVVYVIKNGQMKEVLAEDISVGDLIYLEDNDMIPCDMVVLSTSQVESFQDFLIRLYMKVCIYIVEISIFSLNSVIIRLTKIMNRANKNWAHI